MKDILLIPRLLVSCDLTNARTVECACGLWPPVNGDVRPYHGATIWDGGERFAPGEGGVEPPEGGSGGQGLEKGLIRQRPYQKKVT